MLPDSTVIISSAHACQGHPEGIRLCASPDSSPVVILAARAETRRDVINVVGDQHSASAVPRHRTGSCLRPTFIDKQNFTTPRLQRHTHQVRNIKHLVHTVEDRRRGRPHARPQIHVLAVTETWHEHSHCITMKRLRSLGYNVIETARLLRSYVDDEDIHYQFKSQLPIVHGEHSRRRTSSAA